MYINKSGYANPTEGAALSNVIREEKNAKRHKKHPEMRRRLRIYVVSKYAGDVKQNVANALEYCKFVTSKGFSPFASHLFFTQFLNDNNPGERALGIKFALMWLEACDEVWCFGTELSEGMEREIEFAEQINKPIRYFTSDMKELKADEAVR